MRYDRMCRVLLLVGACLLWGTPSTQAGLPMTITDATFTDGVANRTPQMRVTAFSLGDQGNQARLWFWFLVSCGDPCQGGAASITVRWSQKVGDQFAEQRAIPLTIQGPTWRTWAYKENLQPGTWKAEVISEQGPVCMSDKCEFTIEVTP